MPSLNTGNTILSNAIKVDSSYNVGIGGAASGSYKLQVTGTGNFTGALTGTSATFSSSVTNSFGSAGANFNSNGATTSYVNAYRASNTNGVGSYGIESNAGNELMAGGLANATLLQSITNTALQLGTNQTARLTITSGGTVTIQTPTSGVALLVNGKASEWTGQFQGINSTGISFGIKINAGTNSSDAALLIKNAADNIDYFRVRGDGLLVSLPTYNNTTALGANMYVSEGGIFYRSTSSLKYKTDVYDYNKGLDVVNQLRPVYYKGKNDGDKQFAGLIAEEVHELGLTEFVQYASDGTPDALAYQNMVALAFKAIQEQQAQIEAQQQQINSLINR